MLNTAVKAARKAGAIITRAAFDVDKLTIRTKHQHDFVSEVDHAAEDAIISILRQAYPSHGFLAEESGEKDAKAEYVWVIDPLDGTTNFLHGFPQYCVSIGLLHKGKPQQAVVYDPNRNELFTATKGGGAFVNDHRIRVSKTDKLQDALLGTGFPFRELENIDEYLRGMKRLMHMCSGIRRPGAAALDLAWVAAGRFDGFWEDDLDIWDTAAGVLLVKEAGGFVSDYRGQDRMTERREYLAASGELHSRLHKLLAGSLR